MVRMKSSKLVIIERRLVVDCLGPVASGVGQGVRNAKWWNVLVVLLGTLGWLELFLRWPMESVVLLVAIGGWWDYQRRRAKLKPPSY